jgi:hypothetical protein
MNDELNFWSLEVAWASENWAPKINMGRRDNDLHQAPAHARLTMKSDV